LQAFAHLISVTDIANVPHFDLSSDPCVRCLEQEAEQVKALSGEIQRAKVERVCQSHPRLQAPRQADPSSFLQDRLKEMTNRGFLESSNEIYAGLPAYLLSHAFVRQWLEWIEDPIEIPRPVFNNRPLLCIHNQLHVDLEWFPDRRAGIFTVVYHDLWGRIVSLCVSFQQLQHAEDR
jgi:hypothetical protein